MKHRVHRLFPAIRALLRADWDPIPGSPEDEYDDYVWGVISRLERGEDDAAIASYLDHVVADLIAIGPSREVHFSLAGPARALKSETA